MSTPWSGNDPGTEPGRPPEGDPGPTSPPVVPPSPPQPPPPQPPPPTQSWQEPGGQPAYGGAAGYGYAPAREHAPGAVASLVCGILGLFTIPLVLSIVAVVLGNQSKRATVAEPHRYNDQFGQVGRILGWVGIGLAVLGLLFIIAFLVFLMPFGVSMLGP